jgi:hypothetical protein
LFAKPLIKLAKAMGINVELLTADEAYYDGDGSIYKETGVHVIKAIATRKNCERPFNFMKKREGLEQTRVRSQQGVVVRFTITTIATLLIDMMGTRKKQKKKNKKDNQMDLFKKAG